MTLSEIAKNRLVNQQLAGTKFKSAVDLVQWFGVMQAQEYKLTTWAIGLRVPNLKETNVEKDFADGKILRTHLLRPTWHFVTASDIRWMLKLTAPRIRAASAYMYRQVELDNRLFKKSNRLFTKILAGGKQLTRNQINEIFQKNKIIATGQRLSYIMMYAELEGIICSGAKQGNQFTYALLEERVPVSPTLSAEDALAELSKRYFTSRGPATLKDFSTWSGLTLGDCKKGLNATGTQFIKELLNGEEYYFSPGSNLKNINPSIYLLPTYDELIMGYKNRTAFAEYKNSLKTPVDFHYDSMIVHDGQIIGTWKRTHNKKFIHLEYEFFSPLNTKQKKLFKQAIQRYEEFTELKTGLTRQIL